MKKLNVKKRVATILLAVLAAVSLGLACFFMSTPNTNVVGAFTRQHAKAFGTNSGHSTTASGSDTIQDIDLCADSPSGTTVSGNVITINEAGSYYLSADLNAALVINVSGSNTTVNLCLNGYMLNASVADTSAITVEAGSLVLFDCMESSTNGNHQHTYYVNEHGKYVFGETAPEGATTYTLTGGVITGGTGSMNSDEDTTFGGGIFLEGNGTSLTMYGGKIAGNMAKRDLTADGYNSNDETYGGGVYVESGASFIMLGGNISGNTAGASNTVGSIDQNDLDNDHDRGGGVAVDGVTFIMYGGEIKNNAADDGAGVYVDGDGFEMLSSSAGTENITIDGTEIEYSTFAAKISGNTARHNGGGIYINDGVAVVGSTGGDTATGGTITNNSANSFGGGIYVNRNGTAELQVIHANITGNSAMTGGGVYVHSGRSISSEDKKTITGYSSGSLVLGDSANTTAEGSTPDVVIVNNSAIYYDSRPLELMNGYGGGVFMRNHKYIEGEKNSNGDDLVNGADINFAESNIDIFGYVIIKNNSSQPLDDDGGADNLYLEDGISINEHNGSDYTAVDGSNDAGNTINTASKIGITLAAREDNYYDESTFIKNGFGENVTETILEGVFSSDVGGELNADISDGTGEEAKGTITVGSFIYKIPVEINTTEAHSDYSAGITITGAKDDDGHETSYSETTKSLQIDSRYKNIVFTITPPANTDYIVVTLNDGQYRVGEETGGTVTYQSTIYSFNLTNQENAGVIFEYENGTLTLTVDYAVYTASAIGEQTGIHIDYVGAEASVEHNSITELDNTKYYQTIEQAFEAADELNPRENTPANITMLKNADTAETLTVSNSDFVTLDLNGHVLSMASGSTGSVISVTTGANFTLTDGDNDASNTVNSTAFTGGVLVGSGGTQSASDKTINCGGGVYVNGATFNMTGGTITGGTAQHGAGVYVTASGTFNMSAGTITGNTAESGGGVYIASGSFTMSGTAEISNNKATNSSASGAGVYMAGGKFEMSAGTISNNQATGNGGGVFMSHGNFTMSGGDIKGNSAVNGGAVYLNSDDCTFTMSDGTIGGTESGNGNTASVNGGGVYIVSGATFNMSGGMISGNNTASGTNHWGGGVYVVGKFTMSGTATISGNTSSSHGGGVYVGHNGYAECFAYAAQDAEGFFVTDSGEGVDTRAVCLAV